MSYEYREMADEYNEDYDRMDSEDGYEEEKYDRYDKCKKEDKKEEYYPCVYYKCCPVYEYRKPKCEKPKYDDCDRKCCKERCYKCYPVWDKCDCRKKHNCWGKKNYGCGQDRQY